MPLTSCKSQLKFSQQSFPEPELPDLLHNIWCYTNRPNDPTCIQYQKWWVQEAKEDWQSYYKDFGHVIEKLKKQDKKFYNLEEFLLKIKTLYIESYVKSYKL